MSGTSFQCAIRSTPPGRAAAVKASGVSAADWVKQRKRPATAEPLVPSICTTMVSSRRGRVAQLLVIMPTAPPCIFSRA